MKFRITTRIWNLSAVAVVATIALCAATLVQIHHASKAIGWVEHTQEIIAESNAVLARIAEAETSQRGYLLTSDPRYLAHYVAIATERDDLLVELARLTADNATQKVQLAHLDQLVREKFDRMDAIVGLARDGHLDQALATLREGSSNRAMELVRQGFATVITVERTLLGQRKAEAEQVAENVERAVVVGGLLAALLVLFACFRLARRLNGAFGALTDGIAVVSDGDLEHRIPVTADDEIGRIATAFNVMAGHLADVRRVRDHAEQELQQINAELLDRGAELEQRTGAIDLLGKMAHRLQAAANEAEFGDVVARFVPQILPAIPGALYLLNNSRNLLVRAAEWLDPRSTQPSFTPDACWGLRRGQPHVVGDIRRDVCCDHVGAEAVDGYVCLPLLARGDIVGLLYLEAANIPGLGGSLGYDYTAVLAENVALALVNHRLRESLKEQSIRDPLTGLFNRRYLEEAAALEFARAARSESQVGVLMLDVDHFKRFNDTFGHDAGDQVLCHVAQVLHGQVRGGDVVCRFGGEEFTVVLPGATPEQAAERAELVRQAVKAMSVNHRGEALGHVSISIGVAAFPAHGADPAAVMAAADAALYRAKEAGRDRVATASVPVPA